MEMNEQFQKYCKYLKKERTEREQDNPIQRLKRDFESGRLDFYDFLDKTYQWNKSIHVISDNLKHSGISSIEIRDGCVTYTSKENSIDLIFDGKDRRAVPFELLSWGEYEKEELILLNSLITDGMSLFDVGANIGWYSLNWSKLFPNSHIYSFEPIPTTFKFLSANKLINGAENIFEYNLALSNSIEEKLFYYSPESAVLSSEKNIMEYQQAERVKVKVSTVDEIVKSEGIACVDLIRYDVEGAEFNSLKGSMSTISKHYPILVLELFHEWSKWFDYHPQEVFGFLFNLGYLAFLPDCGYLEAANYYQSENFSKQNYFFLHQNHHRQLIKDFSKGSQRERASTTPC